MLVSESIYTHLDLPTIGTYAGADYPLFEVAKALRVSEDQLSELMTLGVKYAQPRESRQDFRRVIEDQAINKGFAQGFAVSIVALVRQLNGAHGNGVCREVREAWQIKKPVPWLLFD